MMKIKTHNIKMILIIFLLVFPQIRPSCIAVLFPFIGRLYNYASFLSFLIIVFLIFRRSVVKIQPVLLFMILMELWASVTTYIHNAESLLNNIFSFTSAISIPLIIFYFSSEEMDSLITALLMNFEWLIYASLISIVLYFPNGMYLSGGKVQYFLGNENGIVFFVIPAMFLALIYIRKEGKQLRGVCLLIACVANELIVWCATAVVGMLAALFIVLLMVKKKKHLNYYTILISILIANYVITVARVFDKYWLFNYIVENLLNKTLTFSGRTHIWDAAVNVIQSNMITGLGRGDHVPYRGGLFHAHNEYFQLLLVGGIPLLILFFCVLLFLGKKINRTMSMDYTHIVTLAMLTCLFIQFIATSRLTFRLYVPLILAYYVDDIQCMINKKCQRDTVV